MAIRPLSNLPLKLLAVAMAALLWFVVSRDQMVERNVRVPLEFQNVPDGLELIGDPPSTVAARVRGASSLLSRIEAGDVVAVVDVRDARPGTRLFHLISDHVRVPFGVAVAQISPSTVSLSFEPTGRRRVPVVPMVDGEPAAGYVAGRATSDPAEVVVSGPESHLKRLEGATTEPVSLRNATRTVVDRVTVGVTDSALRLEGPTVAVVTVPVTAALVERTLTGVPVQVRGLGGGLRAALSPPTVTAGLRGERDVVGRRAASEVSVFVDLGKLGPGSYTVPVQAAEAERYAVERIAPATVRVRIR